MQCVSPTVGGLYYEHRLLSHAGAVYARHSRVSIQKRHHDGSTHCVGCGCEERGKSAPGGPEGEVARARMAHGPYCMDRGSARPGEIVEDTGHRDGDAAEGVIDPCLPDGTSHVARGSGPATVGLLLLWAGSIQNLAARSFSQKPDIGYAGVISPLYPSSHQTATKTDNQLNGVKKKV
jgi:hypothetical protein